MSKESKTVTYKVDDKDFKLEFGMLSPSKSLIFLMFMGKIIGGSAGKVMGSIDGSVAKLEDLMDIKADAFNLEKLGGAIFGLFDRVDEKEVIEKLNVLFTSVTANDEVVDMDYFMFDGRPDLIFKVAGKAMAVNYKRFLGESSGLLSKLRESLRILKGGTNSQSKQT